ncbi:MAG: putative metallopeptidase [Sulfolobaceae archaeon]|nr:putative metallopeptidase [Sulfolobaceae archaeon]
MVKYKRAVEEEKVVSDLVKTLGLSYIDTTRIRVVYSIGAKTKAIARIWAIPKAITLAFDLKPLYVIELVSEKFIKLNEDQKLRVLIHELLHIPESFSGGLRPHGQKVNARVVNRLYKEYTERKKTTS